MVCTTVGSSPLVHRGLEEILLLVPFLWVA